MSISASRRWIGLAVLCTAFFMVVLDVAIVNVALPSIQRDLGFSQSGLQWIVSAYALTFGGLLLLGGRAADILGRRRILMGGVALFTLASLFAGLATSPATLIAARALQGAGAAAMTPASLSLLIETFPAGRERNTALGVWGAVGATGGTVGLILGGVLTEKAGWEWLFFLNVPFGIAVFALAPFVLVPAARRTCARCFDAAGAVTVTAALTLLVYALVTGGNSGWSSTHTLGLIAAAVALLGVFAAIERRAKAPVIPFGLLQRPLLVAANASGLLLGAAFNGMIFLVTLYLQRALGYSPLQTGIAWLALSLPSLAASVTGAWLVGRIGLRAPLVLGPAIAALSMWLLSRLPADAAYARDLLPPLVIAGVGIGLGSSRSRSAQSRASTPPTAASRRA
jgi:EmrB/QacA subfamily drug resistance transporter